MKRLFSFLLIFLITVSFSSADTIINDINNFSKLFPRDEGSLYEKDTLNMIKQRLDESGVSNRQVSFSEAEGYHSFSSYIEADIEGHKADKIITIIPVSESSYGIAAGLAMIEHFLNSNPQLSLKFVFLGAEDDFSNLLGTKNFIEHFYPEEQAYFIYLNFKTTPASVKITAGADGYCSPFSLFSAAGNALQKASIPYLYSNTETLLYRLSAAGTESRIAEYLQEGYPAIELSTLTTAEPAELIDSAALTIFYNSLLSEFSEGLPAEWDRHYIFGINEQSYLIIYLAVMMLLMIYPIFKRRHFGWYMHTLFKNIWVIPLLYITVFGFLSLTSFLLNLLLSHIDFPELWKYKPIEIFILKISLAMLMYSLAFKLLSKLPFSKRGSFYSISSIVFLVFVVFILTAVDFSISFFALWPLCFIFLFTVFRRPALKFLMLLISSAWLIFTLVEVFSLPSYKVIKLITLSPVQGDMLSAIIMMPFILAAIRLDMLSPPSKRFTRFVPLILAAVSAGLLLTILVFSPFSESNPQPVFVTETVDDNLQTRELSFNSPAPISRTAMEEISQRIITPPSETEIVSVKIDVKSFLNRKIINTRLDFTEKPADVHVSLFSEEPVTLFESGYPAEWLPSRNELVVYIGRNPAFPLEFSLTLNKDAPINFLIRADYDERQRVVTVEEKPYLLSQSRSITKNYSYEK